MQSRWLIVLPFLSAAIICLFLCLTVLDGITHIPDETAYLFQGRIFAAGKLRIEPPRVPEAFKVDHILITSNGWYTVYPPGWPLLLSFGWLIHAPWIINPLLAGLSAAAVFHLGTQLYGKRIAVIAVLFFIASPFTLFMGAGFMSHMACLCAAVWCASMLVSGMKTEQTKFWVVAGVLAGAAFLIRPFSASVLLFPAFLWIAVQKKSAVFKIAAGAIPMFGLFLIYNALQYGHPFKTGYESDPYWRLMDFSASYLWNNAKWFAGSLNRMLWGWPFANLLIFIPLLFKDEHSKSDLLIAACSISLIAGHSFFSYHDIVYAGPRYVFELMGFTALLAARSMHQVQRFAGKKAFWVTTAALLIVPPVFSLPQQIRYHSQIYHGQSGEFLKPIDQTGDDSLILLSGDRYVLRTFFFENALNPSDGKRVFCTDIPEMQNYIFKAYPRKEVWRYTIELLPLQGPNTYTDRWTLKRSELVPLK